VDKTDESIGGLKNRSIVPGKEKEERERKNRLDFDFESNGEIQKVS
jgi:hypothetical protein